MAPRDPADDFSRLLPFLPELQLTLADRIALAASYDQCAAQIMQLHQDVDVEVRQAMLNLTLPRLAVTGLTCLGGLISYLTHPDSSVKQEVRHLLLAAANGGQYPEAPGELR